MKIMKASIFKYILAVAMFTPLLSSCADYLDKEEDTELTLDLVFEDKTRVEGWLGNAY